MTVSPSQLRTLLFACVAMTYAVAVLGGIVRLSGAGLSITVWQPIAGVVPPLTASAWHDSFAAYQASPEYAATRGRVDEFSFRTIYWLEYAHRLLARAVGIFVVVVTALALAHASAALRWRMLLATALVLAQGVAGWLMVKSGLVDRPTISHYRLALHLTLALGLLAVLLDAVALLSRSVQAPAVDTTWLALGLVVVIGLGALVAGLKAGPAYTTFPSFDGRWLPDFGSIAPRDWLDDRHLVHALHRLAGVAALLAVAGHAIRRRHSRAWVTLVLALVQVILGILTVSTGTLPWLASLHQANALLLFMSVIISRRTGGPTPASLARLGRRRITSTL